MGRWRDLCRKGACGRGGQGSGRRTEAQLPERQACQAAGQPQGFFGMVCHRAGFQGRESIRAGNMNRPSGVAPEGRSEEHTSELQSLMRTSYAVFCLKKKKVNRYKSSHKEILNQPIRT